MKRMLYVIICTILLWSGWGFSINIGESSLSVKVYGIKKLFEKKIDNK
ncbi:MAG: hypothetical protein ACRCXT_23950 [Paraclostridium sp.]